MYRRSTPQSLKLKSALEAHGLIVQAEKWDGHKHIDLVIHRSRLNIEIDGKQHYEDSGQILSDLMRTHFSDDKGYDTIHIPNVVIDSESDLKRVANALAKAAKIRAKQLGYRHHFHSYT